MSDETKKKTATAFVLVDESEQFATANAKKKKLMFRKRSINLSISHIFLRQD
ncbi:MAG: hypothetical protein ACI9ZF_001611 [Bradyrhizobium sp.]|jgi:hypothetical protein